MNKDWLKDRKIGSSDAPTIMQESPYSTPYQLWERKITGEELPINGGMKRGTQMEPIARCVFEEKMNTIVFPRSLVHPKWDYMTANVDGLDLDEKILVEIKCPNKDDHAIAVTGKVPQKYYAQCQHQLEVTGLSGMYYFSFDGSKGVIVEVQKDQRYLNELIEKEREFWNMILDFTPPELTEKDYVDLTTNSQWIDIAKQLEEIKVEKKKIKELEDKEKELIEKLASLSENKSAVGLGYKFTKFVKKGLVDYTQIPELQSVNKEIYRKPPSTQWRFSC